MDYDKRIEQIWKFINAQASLWKPNGIDKDEKYKYIQHAVIELCLTIQAKNEAKKTGFKKSQEDISTEAAELANSDVVGYYFGRKKAGPELFRAFLGIDENGDSTEVSKALQKKELTNLMGWMNEYAAKKSGGYYDYADTQMENEPSAVGDDNMPLEVSIEKTQIVEKAYADNFFTNTWRKAPIQGLTDDERNNLRTQFTELWNLVGAIKEIDYSLKINPTDLYNNVVKGKYTNVEGKDPQAAEKFKTSIAALEKKALGNKGIVSQEKAKAISGSYYYLFDYSDNPNAGKENRQTIKNLLSDDPNVVTAERRKLYQKAINMVLSIPEAAFTPNTDVEAMTNYEQYYHAINVAIDMSSMLTAGGLEQEVTLPENIKEALEHKSKLAQEFSKSYISKYKILTDPRLAKINFLSSFSNEVLTELAGDSKYHDLSKEDKELVKEVMNIKQIQEEVVDETETDKKFDGLQIDKLEFKQRDLVGKEENTNEAYQLRLQQIEETLKNYEKIVDAGERLDYEQEQTFNSFYTEHLLIDDAIKTNSGATIGQIQETLQLLKDVGLVDVWKKGGSEKDRIKESLNPEHKNRKRSFDLVAGWAKEVNERKEYYKAYDNLPKAEKDLLIRLVPETVKDETLRQNCAKRIYAENKIAEVQFDKFAEAQAKIAGFAGPGLEDQKIRLRDEHLEEYKKLHLLNQKVKSENYSEGKSKEKVYSIAVKSDPTPAELEIHNAFKDKYDWDVQTSNERYYIDKYGDLWSKKPAQNTAMARILPLQMNPDNNEQVDALNKRILANLSSKDPNVVRAQRLACYDKAIRDVLALDEEMLSPDFDNPESVQSAKVYFVNNYKAIMQAHVMDNVLKEAPSEMHMSPELISLLKHKNALVIKNVMKIKDDILKMSHSDYKVDEVLEGVDINTMMTVSSSSPREYFPQDVNTQGELKDVLSIALGKENDQKIDEVGDVRLNFTDEELAEVKIIPKLISSHLNDNQIAKKNSVVEYYTLDNRSISEFEADEILFNGGKVVTKVYPNQKSMEGTSTIVSFDGLKVQNTKLYKSCHVVDLTMNVRTIEDQVGMLKKVKKSLDDTEAPFAATEAFTNLQTSLANLINAHNELGKTLNARQIEDLQTLYDDVRAKADAYLVHKIPELAGKRNKGEHDVRGELRTEFVYNLKNLVSDNQSDIVINKFDGSKEYRHQREVSNSISALLALADTDEFKIKNTLNPDIQKMANLSNLAKNVLELSQTPEMNNVLAKSMLADKMAPFISKLNNLIQAKNMIEQFAPGRVEAQLAELNQKYAKRNQEGSTLITQDEINQLNAFAASCIGARNEIRELPGIKHYANRVENMSIPNVTPLKQASDLEKTMKILKDTNDSIFIKNSTQFNDILRDMPALVSLQKSIGNYPTDEQKIQLAQQYASFREKCQAYLDVKEPKLREALEKNKRDRRGELRFNTISSLMTILDDRHLESLNSFYEKSKAHHESLVREEPNRNIGENAPVNNNAQVNNNNQPQNDVPKVKVN